MKEVKNYTKKIYIYCEVAPQMKKQSLFEHISIDYLSVTPKYLQLANAIIKGISDGKIKKDDVLPSINELSFEYEISRDTAEKGYKYLKEIGVLSSVPGKGYFVKTFDIKRELKIFLLFNKLSPHKKVVYDAFAEALIDIASIDFYIYNNDYGLFKRLIQNAKRDYTHYVIIPHFLEGGENAHEIINTIPTDKLILLDKLLPGVNGDFSSVYEDFEKDIYHALEQALPQLSKYHTIKIIFPKDSYFPQEILKGFYRFCQQYAFNYKVVHVIQNEPIKEGTVYLSLMESDLVLLIEKILVTKLKVGKHVGVISYNESQMKKIILNGITTISTDFEMMGKKTAELITSNSIERVPIPFSLTLRPSL
jgi:DNA-binding transcriptional regulator YhcF (GntR family)